MSEEHALSAETRTRVLDAVFGIGTSAHQEIAGHSLDEATSMLLEIIEHLPEYAKGQRKSGQWEPLPEEYRAVLRLHLGIAPGQPEGPWAYAKIAQAMGRTVPQVRNREARALRTVRALWTKAHRDGQMPRSRNDRTDDAPPTPGGGPGGRRTRARGGEGGTPPTRGTPHGAGKRPHTPPSERGP